MNLDGLTETQIDHVRKAELKGVWRARNRFAKNDKAWSEEFQPRYVVAWSKREVDGTLRNHLSHSIPREVAENLASLALEYTECVSMTVVRQSFWNRHKQYLS